MMLPSLAVKYIYMYHTVLQILHYSIWYSVIQVVLHSLLMCVYIKNMS